MLAAAFVASVLARPFPMERLPTLAGALRIVLFIRRRKKTNGRSNVTKKKFSHAVRREKTRGRFDLTFFFFARFYVLSRP